MTKTFRVLDYDIIYLSYDEPNAEKNYADLCQKVPWAKRVHGIEGSDAAHKACAELSETSRFITIDGDNIVDPKFLEQEIDFSEHEDLENCVLSWSAVNQINGLIYGNGGIKCWPKQHVLGMRTHEAADPRNKAAQVEFCWDVRYIQMEGHYSVIHNNESPMQAWRAGFREGVKMCLDQGVKPENKIQLLNNHWKNMHRLYVWTMIGADTKHGMYAIYGAREGLYKTMCTDWDFVNVRDFKWLTNYWNEEVSTMFDSEHEILDESIELGKKIIKELELPIAEVPFDAQQSRFFKEVYRNPHRLTYNLIEREK